MDPSRQTATSQTAYKWAFTSKRTKADDDALQAARAEVGAATYGASNGPSRTPGDGSIKRVQGPTLPPQADRTLAREAAEEEATAEREYQRKRDKAEARDRVEDMVGPREVGRERMLEKKRERRDNDRAFREKGDEGLDVDERTLMGGGGGDSFKAQWVLPCITHFVHSPTHPMRTVSLLQGCPQRCCACEVRAEARGEDVRDTRAGSSDARKGQSDNGHVHANGQAEVWVTDTVGARETIDACFFLSPCE